MNPATIKASALPIAGVIFSLVVGITGYLRYEISTVSAEIVRTKQENSEYQMKISELRNDPMIMAADLLLQNRPSIEASINRSKAQDYVTELMRLHRDYDVDFDSFSFVGWKVSTLVSSRAHAGESDPIGKITQFIGDFRTGSGSAASSVLTLGDIQLVSGDESKRSFAVDLQAKP